MKIFDIEKLKSSIQVLIVETRFSTSSHLSVLVMCDHFKYHFKGNF